MPYTSIGRISLKRTAIFVSQDRYDPVPAGLLCVVEFFVRIGNQCLRKTPPAADAGADVDVFALHDDLPVHLGIELPERLHRLFVIHEGEEEELFAAPPGNKEIP